MATFTAEASGAMNSDATWAGTGTPGVSDQTVNNGFTVTVTADHLTDGTGGHDVGSGGIMAIDGGIELRAGGGWLELTGTAILRHSGTGAGAALVGQLAGQIVVANGTDASNRVQILGVDATQHIRFEPGHTNAGTGRIQLDLCSLEFVGNSSNPLVKPYLHGSGLTMYITNSVGVSCGSIFFPFTFNPHGASIFRFNNNNFSACAAAVINMEAAPDTLTTGVREILSNYADSPPRTFGTTQDLGGFTIEDNAFVGKLSIVDLPVPASFARNLIIKEEQGSHQLTSGATDCYWLQDSTDSNPHFVSMSSGKAGTFTYHGNISETNSSQANGDSFLIPNAVATFVIEESIVLPNSAGGISGTLVSMLGGSDILGVSADHNTFIVGASGSASGIAGGETYSGHADLCSSARSNIGWTNGVDGAIVNAPAAPVDDFFTVADFNCGYNISGDAAFSDNYHPADAKFGATPGPNDVNVDPLFVDATRNFASFGASLGGAGTVADTRAEFAKMNLSTWDPGYTPAAAVTWVRGGFAPQNATVQNAGHDGVTIGAVELFAAATGHGPLIGGQRNHLVRAA